MSREGDLYFFTTARQLDMRTQIITFLSECDIFEMDVKRMDVDHVAERYLRWKEHPSLPYPTRECATNLSLDEEETRPLLANPELVAALYCDDSVLLFRYVHGDCDFASRIRKGLLEMPDDVRGDFLGGAMHVWFGDYDLFGYNSKSEEDKEFYYGKATIQISFGGYGMPYRRLREGTDAILQNPTVLEVRRSLESLFCQPFQSCCSWSY